MSTVAAASALSAASGSAASASASTGASFRRRAASPLDRDHTAADEPDRRREPSLCPARGERVTRGGEGGGAQRPRRGEVRREDGEGSPGGREPESAVEAAAEQLEVVRDDEERADRDEDEQPERARDRDRRCRSQRRRRSRPRRASTSTGGEMRVCSGRPRSSSRACAPTPIASTNASVVQPSSAQSIRGASAAPTATYERCQSVYGGWRSVT